MHNDNLAFGGYSASPLLTTSMYVSPPIIGVISINMPGTQFKWAKAIDTPND